MDLTTTNRAALRSSVKAARRRSRKTSRRACSRRKSSSRDGSFRARSLVVTVPFSPPRGSPSPFSLKNASSRRLDAILLWTFAIRRAKARGDVAVVLLAGLEAFGPSLAPHAPGVAAEHLRFDARSRHAGRKTQRRAQRGRVGEGAVVSAEGLGAGERLGQKLIKSGGARLERDQVQRGHAFARGAEFRERRVTRLDEQSLRFGVVENLEMSRDVRLEGKEPEQPLGEGVQRLNLKAAWGFDRAGEQLPREGQFRWIGRVRAAVDDRMRQGLVVEARPLRELG